jgi:UrcA family protein
MTITKASLYCMAVAAMAGVLAICSASAERRGEAAPTVSISLAGLDLTNDRDVRILRHRVNGAAAEVCPEIRSSEDLSLAAAVRHCRQAAIRGAGAQMDLAIERQIARKNAAVETAMATKTMTVATAH